MVSFSSWLPIQTLRKALVSVTGSVRFRKILRSRSTADQIPSFLPDSSPCFTLNISVDNIVFVGSLLSISFLSVSVPLPKSRFLSDSVRFSKKAFRFFKFPSFKLRFQFTSIRHQSLISSVPAAVPTIADCSTKHSANRLNEKAYSTTSDAKPD